MDTIENKLSEYIEDVRQEIDNSDIKNKKKIGEKLDYIEDSLQDMLNYIYAEIDNLEDLKESVNGR